MGLGVQVFSRVSSNSQTPSPSLGLFKSGVMGKRGRDRSPTPTPEWLCEQAAPRGVPEFVRPKYMEALGHLKHFGTVSNMIQTIYTALIAIEPFIRRGLHCVELCCGFGEISYWVRKWGYQAHEFDRRRHPSEDITMPLGIFWAGILVLRVVEFGFLILEPQCSTWTCMCTNRHARHKDIQGNCKSRTDVREGNTTAEVMSMLWRFAHGRKVRSIKEQPSNSCYYNFPTVQKLIE